MCSINHEKKIIFLYNYTLNNFIISNFLEKYYNFISINQKRPDYINDISENININTYYYVRTSNFYNRILGMNDNKWKTYKIFYFVLNPYIKFMEGLENYIEINNIKIDENINLVIDKVFKNNCYITNNINSINDNNVFIFKEMLFHQKKNIFCINNKLIVDYIGKFENLFCDIKNILLKYGFEENSINLPELINIENIFKKNNLTIIKNYEKYINNESLQLINTYFKDDFDFFNYDYLLDGIHV